MWHMKIHVLLPIPMSTMRCDRRSKDEKSRSKGGLIFGISGSNGLQGKEARWPISHLT